MYRYLFGIFLIINSFNTRSQELDTLHLEDVTITVTPFADRLSTSTGSLTIIRKTGETGYLVNIADELNMYPGIFMASGTNTTNRLTIRGIGSRTPYNSNRIRAYYEDIPLTGGDGVSTIEDMDISGINRMEIIRGPASAVYGSGMGGVVKIKAIMPVKEGFSMQMVSDFATYKTFKNSVVTGWKSDKSNISAGYSRVRSEGYRQNNHYNRDQAFLNMEHIAGKSAFNLNLVATVLDAGIPSSLSAYDFEFSPESAASNWLDVRGFEEYKKVLAGIGWNFEPAPGWTSRLVVFSGWQDPYESRPFNILDESSVMFGLREYVRYNRDNFTLSTGVEVFNESYAWKIFETLSGSQGALQLYNTEKRQYGNIFLHSKYYITGNWTIEAGLNLNLLGYKINTEYNLDSTDQSGEYSYRPVLAPRIGINYSLDENHFIHASAGYGFSAPSLEETLLPEGLINPELDPETGWNYDAGFRGWLLGNSWYYDATFYLINVRNLLVTKRISEEIFTGINAGAAILGGIEVYNRITLTGQNENSNLRTVLENSLFLSRNRFTDFVDDSTDQSGNNLPGIPARTASARLVMKYADKIEFIPEIIYTGKQFLDDGNMHLYNGHSLINLKMGYTITIPEPGFSISVFGGIRNLLDESYASMVLVNAPSFGGSDPRYYYPGLPRNFHLGLKIEF